MLWSCAVPLKILKYAGRKYSKWKPCKTNCGWKSPLAKCFLVWYFLSRDGWFSRKTWLHREFCFYQTETNTRRGCGSHVLNAKDSTFSAFILSFRWKQSAFDFGRDEMYPLSDARFTIPYLKGVGRAFLLWNDVSENNLWVAKLYMLWHLLLISRVREHDGWYLLLILFWSLVSDLTHFSRMSNFRIASSKFTIVAESGVENTGRNAHCVLGK